VVDTGPDLDATGRRDGRPPRTRVTTAACDPSDALRAAHARSRFLATASRRLGLTLHPGRTARAAVELAVELAEAAAVVWPALDGDGTVEWVCGLRGGPLRTGRAVAAVLPGPVRSALRGHDDPTPLLVDDLAGEPWIDVAAVGAPVTAGTVTLPGNGMPAGALVLLRRATGPHVRAAATDDDAALVEEFAQRAGIALAAAGLYARQVRVVAVLRDSLSQPPLPSVPGLSLGAAHRAADEALLIGGDLYDVLPGPDGGTTFLLGDVCGKGVDAAVGTGRLRHSVRALRCLVDAPVRLLELLNLAMLDVVPLPPKPGPPRFVTLVLGTATPRPDGGVGLRLAAGGHQPPMIVRRDGTVEPVEIDGMMLGAVPDARVGHREVDLAPGEACVLYTDGVTEARGGVDGRETFGEHRLASLLRGCQVLPAPGIAERVVAGATRWSVAGHHHDDVAVLVVQAPIPARHRAGVS
jgi:serine phosphatase RsbU (regulator of sigma subunit)